MSFVCLWIPGEPTGAGAAGASDDKKPLTSARPTHADLPTALLAITPHVVVAGRGLIWVDARGLRPQRVATRALELARKHATPAARVSAAGTAIVAEVAALHGGVALAVIGAGEEARFLAPFPLAVLAPPVRLVTVLADIGVHTCGDLARLTQEAVEVRFGTEGVALWRLARADDPRRIFSPTPRALPSASLTWEEYAVRDPEQLLFTTNRLMANVCAELRTWGEGARAMTLGFTLASRNTVEHPLRAARETASRASWMRLVRTAFDQVRLPDGVVGLSIRVDAVGEAGVWQGDAFDRGFPTAGALDDALERVVDDHHGTIVQPLASAHPLPERRTRRVPRAPTQVPQVARPGIGSAAGETWSAPRLVLQLFPDPPRVDVTTAPRRDHRAPVRVRVRSPLPEVVPQPSHDIEILTAVGPDYLSGGAEDVTAYAREYFHCLTTNGILMLLFRDARTDTWYLHGWWD